jgi:small-conductance mechanosensitive channel
VIAVLNRKNLGDPVSANRRSGHRFDVEIPATLLIDGDGREVTIQNLALGGAQVAMSERLALGRHVRISFRVPTLGDTIEVEATVRWVQTGSVGLQFAGLRPKHVWSLNRYFATLPRQSMAADGSGP